MDETLIHELREPGRPKLDQEDMELVSMAVRALGSGASVLDRLIGPRGAFAVVNSLAQEILLNVPEEDHDRLRLVAAEWNCCVQDRKEARRGANQ